MQHTLQIGNSQPSGRIAEYLSDIPAQILHYSILLLILLIACQICSL